MTENVWRPSHLDLNLHLGCGSFTHTPQNFVRQSHLLRTRSVGVPPRGVRGGECTYYWSGSPHGHLENVVVAVADRLIPMVTEVTPVNERVMRLRIFHTLGVIFLVCVYAPTGISEFSVKKTLYAQPLSGLVSHVG